MSQYEISASDEAATGSQEFTPRELHTRMRDSLAGNALTGFHGSRLDVCITSWSSVIRVFSKTGDIDLLDSAGHHSITEL